MTSPARLSPRVRTRRTAPRSATTARAASTPSAASDGPTSPLAKLLVGLSSQVALIGAALYYFGWAKAQAWFEYFGLDTSFTGFSPTDYLLRSVPLVFTPLVPVLLLTFGATFAHTLVITPMLSSTARARAVACWVVRAVQPACVVMLVAVVASLAWQWATAADLGVALPLAMAGATGGYVYCAHLDATHHLSPRRGAPGRGALVVQRAALVGLFTAAVFWAVGLYAAHVGQEVAGQFGRGERNGSTVVLYATEGIGLDGTGVVATRLDPTVSKFHVRYAGLRLLLKTPDRYLLLPTHWQRGRDAVIVVADSDDIRLDLTPDHAG